MIEDIPLKEFLKLTCLCLHVSVCELVSLESQDSNVLYTKWWFDSYRNS